MNLEQNTEQNIAASRSFYFVQNASLALTISILMVVAGLIFFFAKNLIVVDLLPELKKKSFVIGQTILNPVERALKLGLDVHTLRGMKDYLDFARKDNPEILSLHLRDLHQKILYESVGPSFQSKNKKEEEKSYLAKVPFKKGSTVLGQLEIGMNLEMVRKVYEDSIYDLFAIIFVSLVLAFEILIFVFRSRITEPIFHLMRLMKSVENGKWGDQIRLVTRDEIGLFSQSLSAFIKKTSHFFVRLKSRSEILSILNENMGENIAEKIKILEERYHFSMPLKNLTFSNIFYVRLPLFLFVFAEGLSCSFIPLYSNQLYTPISWISSSVFISLPLVFFMLSYACSQPLFVYFSKFTHQRYVFLTGGILYCVGIFGAVFAPTLWDFIFWRFISGFGYGFFLIACQAFVMEFMAPGKRVQNTAIFMGGFYAANVCGTPIGGLLAEGLGYRNTLLISFCSAFLAVIYAQVYLKPSNQSKPSGVDVDNFENKEQKMSTSSLWSVLKNPHFVKLLVFISIPSRILMAGCVLYAIPLYLKSLGYSPSLIARIIMIYALMIYFLGAVIARFVDRKKNALLMIVLGSSLASMASFIFFFSLDFWGILIFMILFGLGHSISLTSQITIPPMLEQGSYQTQGTSILSVYRFFELLGFAMGPFIVGFLMKTMIAPHVMMLISCPFVIFLVIYVFNTFHKTNTLLKGKF